MEREFKREFIILVPQVPVSSKSKISLSSFAVSVSVYAEIIGKRVRGRDFHFSSE